MTVNEIDADGRRMEVLSQLRAGIESAEQQPARRSAAKEVARAARVADAFQVDDRYEYALELRDNGDARWHQLGNHVQLAASMYEQQRTAAQTRTSPVVIDAARTSKSPPLGAP
ncbi:hypothetical protein [Blastococcus sp. SYSU DS0617]